MYISITAFSINMQGYNLYIFQIPKETQNGSSHPPLNLFLINTHTKKKKKLNATIDIFSLSKALYRAEATVNSSSSSETLLLVPSKLL